LQFSQNDRRHSGGAITKAADLIRSGDGNRTVVFAVKIRRDLDGLSHIAFDELINVQRGPQNLACVRAASHFRSTSVEENDGRRSEISVRRWNYARQAVVINERAAGVGGAEVDADVHVSLALS